MDPMEVDMLFLTRRLPNQGSLLDVPRSVDEMFDRFWSGRRTWSPAVDVVEQDDAYVLFVELPGVPSDAIDLSVTRESLTIRTEKKPADGVVQENYVLRERDFGPIERTFTFQLPVDANAVEAESKHGLLIVKLHKAKEAQPRKIAVRA
jgi:HSP20 family protein